MAKPNYQQARKQRELARKSRQQEKQQRRSTRAAAADATSQVEPLADATTGAPALASRAGNETLSRAPLAPVAKFERRASNPFATQTPSARDTV
jgi:hypothetical protein